MGSRSNSGSLMYCTACCLRTGTCARKLNALESTPPTTGNRLLESERLPSGGCPVRTLIAVAALASSSCFPTLAQSIDDRALQAVLDRLAGYVARYGAQASAIVAVETYTQSVVAEGRLPIKPRKLTAEFAIIKVSGAWTGYRDVFEVDGEKLHDRADRLASLARASADVGQFTKIAEESSRFNIGPVSRTFNVPTAALFFFQPQFIKRFAFTHKGTQTVDGISTWEIDFSERTTPTFITTRAGKNVPAEGTLWVIPESGTVVRTRLKLRKFLDTITSDPPGRPTSRPSSLALREIDSEAEIDVTYRLHKDFGIWLPVKMSEFYSGPLVVRAGTAPVPARASTLASYTDFKQFTTAVRIR